MKTTAFGLLPFFLLMMLLGLTTSCEKEDESDDFQGLIKLELRETFVQSQRHTMLFAMTRDEYPCANFVIDYDYSQMAGHRRVFFRGLKLTGLCVTAFAPARSLIDLGQMEEGSHGLSLQVNDDLMSTNLSVHGDLLDLKILEGEDNEHLHFVEKQVNRLGPQHHWGYVMNKTAGSEEGYDAFLEQLWSTGAVKLEPEEGNHGFFRVADGEMVLFVEQGYYVPERSFVFLYDDEFQNLTDIAEALREQFVIVFFNGAGDHYHNQL